MLKCNNFIIIPTKGDRAMSENQVKENLSAKIDLWKEINAYANKVEETYPLFFSLFIGVIGAILVVFSDTFFDENISILGTVLFLAVPIIIAAIMAYLGYNFRWVAIARMYLATIEKEINNSLGENFFVWNSDIVERFMSKNNFVNTKLLPLVNFLFFFFVWGFLNYAMWSTTWYLLAKIICSFAITALFIACICPFLGNEKVRKFNYQFPQSN